jgi:hypothetical protein
MAEGCYRPEAAMEFWNRMENSGQKGPPQILSTHPSNHNREAKIREWLPQAHEKAATSDCHAMGNYGGSSADCRTQTWTNTMQSTSSRPHLGTIGGRRECLEKRICKMGCTNIFNVRYETMSHECINTTSHPTSPIPLCRRLPIMHCPPHGYIRPVIEDRILRTIRVKCTPQAPLTTKAELLNSILPIYNRCTKEESSTSHHKPLTQSGKLITNLIPKQ